MNCEWGGDNESESFVIDPLVEWYGLSRNVWVGCKNSEQTGEDVYVYVESLRHGF